MLQKAFTILLVGISTIIGAQSLLPAKINDEIILTHTYYSISYNIKHFQPNWVYHIITKNRDLSLKRKGGFKTDPLLTIPHSSTNNDYKASYNYTEYDIGHMNPAQDNTFDKVAMKECFYFSNASPQTHAFNAGDWKRLEMRLRDISIHYDTLHVFSGGYLHDRLPLLNKRVSIPSYFYKVVITGNHHKGYKGIAFLMPHENTHKPLKSFAISIDSLEQFTKIDFCQHLPDHIEDEMEKQVDLCFWIF